MVKKNNAFPTLKRDQKFVPLGVDNPNHLTKIQINEFNKKGYIFPINIFGQKEVDSCREYFNQLLYSAMSNGFNQYEINGWHMHCVGIYDIVTDNRILNFVEDLLGNNIILWGTHFFVKLPKDGKCVSWHQDASYWPLTPSKTVTVWLAIDDATESNGAMKFIPRSHLHSQLEFVDSEPEDNNVLYQKVPDAEKFGDPPVFVTLKAGQISLHTDWLLHGSDYNLTSSRRCGLTMRFVSADVRAHLGWNKNSLICRGSDPSGHWSNSLRPTGENIPIKVR